MILDGIMVDSGDARAVKRGDLIYYKKFDNFLSEPLRAHNTDAGADIFATEDVVIESLDRYIMPLGFGIEVPEGFRAEFYTKTSTFKKGLLSLEPPIDAGYTGEAHVLLFNIDSKPYEIHRGDKIAQLVITPTVFPEFVETNELKGGERGEGAFGSTGDTLSYVKN